MSGTTIISKIMVGENDKGNKMNILIELIDKIKQERWCFGYNGACSTCGMRDVHNEIRRYDPREIVESFEKLYIDDYEKFEEYLTPLKGIYSLITYIHAPAWFKRFNFVDYEKRILEKYNKDASEKYKNARLNEYKRHMHEKDLEIMLKLLEYQTLGEDDCDETNIWKQLFDSNAVTYWNKWQKRMDEYEWKTKNGLNEQQLAKKAKRVQKQLVHKQRQESNLSYRNNVIDNLTKLDTEERLLFIIKDERLPVEFYPFYLIEDIIFNLKAYNQEHLKKLYEKTCKYGKISNNQWKNAKNILNKYFQEQ